MIFAVVETGGKQYRVQAGDVIDVERLQGDVGSTVLLEDVRLVQLDGELSVGAPSVAGARVIAEVESLFKGPKIVVGKYKAKTRYRRTRGHRQPYSRLRIREVVPYEGWSPPAAAAEQQEPEPEVKKPARRRKRQVESDGS